MKPKSSDAPGSAAKMPPAALIAILPVVAQPAAQAPPVAGYRTVVPSFATNRKPPDGPETRRPTKYTL